MLMHRGPHHGFFHRKTPCRHVRIMAPTWTPCCVNEAVKLDWEGVEGGSGVFRVLSDSILVSAVSLPRKLSSSESLLATICPRRRVSILIWNTRCWFFENSTYGSYVCRLINWFFSGFCACCIIAFWRSAPVRDGQFDVWRWTAWENPWNEGARCARHILARHKRNFCPSHNLLV